MKIYKNKKILLVSLAIIICLIIILLSVLLKGNNINKYNNAKLNMNPNQDINLNMEVKYEDYDSYKCLLKFETNDDSEIIKDIEYPNNMNEVNLKNGRKKFAIDYEIKKGKEVQVFKIKKSNGETESFNTYYTISYDANGGSEVEKKEICCKGSNRVLSRIASKRDGYTFMGWSRNPNATEPDKNLLEDIEYVYNPEDGENITYYAVWKENTENFGKDLIEIIGKKNQSGVYEVTAYNENYNIDMIVKNGDLTLDGSSGAQGALLQDGTYMYGNAELDVGTETENAKNMVVLKVNGNLTINSDVKVTTVNDPNYGGPKGFFIYCTGTITNNGEISMTARGAKAEGQNVLLLQNDNGTYEYVPAIGAKGANGASTSNNANGNKGNDGTLRQTGGGGSGGQLHTYGTGSYAGGCTSGAGGIGTSYSGGPGGGAAICYRQGYDGEKGDDNGGKGGNAAIRGLDSATFGGRRRYR